MGDELYVDDEIDLNDDENLETEVPDYHDYKLRLDGGTEPRDYVVGRFQSDAPNLKEAQGLRIFRSGEGTVQKRAENRKLAEHDEELKKNTILKDFSGKRVIRPAKSKKSTYRKKMFPRHLRDWYLEMTSERVENEATVVDTRSFTGTFENSGDATSSLQYAFLLLNDDDTVDLVPIGNRALYRFRARQHKTQTIEQVETKVRSQAIHDAKRLGALEAKYHSSQAKAELMMGSRPDDIEEKKPSVVVPPADGAPVEGEAKPKRRRKAASSGGKEEVDFEATFDDDDMVAAGSGLEEEEAEEETQPKMRRGDLSHASDSEGDDRLEPKLSSVGQEMQRLLEGENRSDDGGGQSPRRPSSPASGAGS